MAKMTMHQELEALREEVEKLRKEKEALEKREQVESHKMEKAQKDQEQELEEELEKTESEEVEKLEIKDTLSDLLESIKKDYDNLSPTSAIVLFALGAIFGHALSSK